MRAFIVYFTLIASACGGAPTPPQNPAEGSPPKVNDLAAAPAGSGDSNVTSAAPAPASSSDGASPKSKRPLTIFSGCGDVAYVAFGDASGSGGKRSIAPSSEIEAPRTADGTQVIWLVDPSGQGLAHVTISPRMKRVEIGRSCRTLDAR